MARRWAASGAPGPGKSLPRAAADEVLDEGLACALVLGRPFVHSEDVLFALLVDSERDDNEVIAHVDAVDDERADRERAQVTAHPYARSSPPVDRIRVPLRAKCKLTVLRL